MSADRNGAAAPRSTRNLPWKYPEPSWMRQEMLFISLPLRLRDASRRHSRGSSSALPVLVVPPRKPAPTHEPTAGELHTHSASWRPGAGAKAELSVRRLTHHLQPNTESLELLLRNHGLTHIRLEKPVIPGRSQAGTQGRTAPSCSALHLHQHREKDGKHLYTFIKKIHLQSDKLE